MGQSVKASHIDYLRRSGDEHIEADNYIANEHGFASYEIDGEQFTIIQCYGNGSWWQNEFMRLARLHNCKTILFATKRNPKTFERKFGYESVATIMTKEVK